MATESIAILHNVTESDTFSSQPQFQQYPENTVNTVQLNAPDGSPVTSYGQVTTYSTITLRNSSVYRNHAETNVPTSVVSGSPTQFGTPGTYADNYGDELTSSFQYYEYQTINASTPAPTPTPTPTPTPAASPALTAEDVGAVNDIFDDYNSSEEAGRSTIQSIVHFIHQNLAALNQDASTVDSDPQTTALGDELAAEISSGHHINLEKFWKAAAQTVSGGALLTGAEAVGLAVGAPTGAATLIGAALITDGVLKVTDAVLGTHYEQKTINHLSSFFHAGHF